MNWLATGSRAEKNESCHRLTPDTTSAMRQSFSVQAPGFRRFCNRVSSCLAARLPLRVPRHGGTQSQRCVGISGREGASASAGRKRLEALRHAGRATRLRLRARLVSPRIPRPPRCAGSASRLNSGGVKFNSQVYLNGKQVGGCFGGYQPFEIDVTGRSASMGRTSCLSVAMT